MSEQLFRQSDIMVVLESLRSLQTPTTLNIKPTP